MGLFRHREPKETSAEPALQEREVEVVSRHASSAHDNWTGLRCSDDGQLLVRFTTVAEAKLVCKQLRLKKKELQLVKRKVTTEQQAVRATYTDATRRAAPKVRGGGTVGTFVRAVQTGNAAQRRKNLAKALAPLESRKASLDRDMTAIDSLILQVQERILQASAS